MPPRSSFSPAATPLQAHECKSVGPLPALYRRHWLARPEKRRIALLASALALVLILMGEARKPGNYHWLWALDKEASPSTAEEADPRGATWREAMSASNPTDGPSPQSPASDDLADRPASGSRELLEQLGVDASRFDRLVDGRPLHTDEEEVLSKVLFRLKDFKLENIDRWARRHLDVAEMAKAPKPLRGEIFALSGRVAALEVCSPLPEVAERYEMPRYYRCDLALNNTNETAIVYARTVPNAWLKSSPVGERAGAMGVFLKLGGEAPALPIFAAQRVAWYPTGLLGDLGMDSGLFDNVVDKQTLLPEERETFYQLLAAVRRGPPGRILQDALAQARAKGVESEDVVPLFKKPAEQRGRLVTVTGAARKVVRVRVPDPDIQARFGIDHYYEISVFTEDSQGNPLVFCVPDLPEGMPLGEGPGYQEMVRLAGFFVKGWAYRVPPPLDAPPEKRNDMTVWKNQAPLLIGPQPVWIPWQKPESSRWAGIVAGSLFALAVLGIWLALWRANRGDKRFRETIFRTAGGPPVTIGALPTPPDAAPDFSRLGEAAPPSKNEGA